MTIIGREDTLDAAQTADRYLCVIAMMPTTTAAARGESDRRVRELRQNLSKHLERVKAGEALVVTERGRIVARLVPAGGPAEPYSELSARFGSSVPTTRLSEVARSLTPPGAREGTTDALLAGGRTERPA